MKGVLTDESQESQESNVFPIKNTVPYGNGNATQTIAQQHQINAPAIRPTTLPNVQSQNNMNSPMSFPPQSPYHSEYSKYVVIK